MTEQALLSSLKLNCIKVKKTVETCTKVFDLPLLVNKVLIICCSLMAWTALFKRCHDFNWGVFTCLQPSILVAESLY